LSGHVPGNVDGHPILSKERSDLFALPIAIWELSLGVWLTFKGVDETKAVLGPIAGSRSPTSVPA
jgi:hypothetical protein